jgi:hypothetical protein
LITAVHREAVSVELPSGKAADGILEQSLAAEIILPRHATGVVECCIHSHGAKVFERLPRYHTDRLRQLADRRVSAGSRAAASGAVALDGAVAALADGLAEYIQFREFNAGRMPRWQHSADLGSAPVAGPAMLSRARITANVAVARCMASPAFRTMMGSRLTTIRWDAMLYHNNALAILPACESLSQASTCTQHLRIGQVGGPLTE